MLITSYMAYFHQRSFEFALDMTFQAQRGLYR